MMLVVTIDVVGRYIFNTPLYGAWDIQELMLVVVVFMSLAYSQKLKVHVFVDVLVSKFSKKIQEILQLFVSLLSSGIWGLLAVQVGRRAWVQITSTTQSGTTTLLEISYTPFIFLTAFGCFLLSLVLLLELTSDISKILSRKPG